MSLLHGVGDFFALDIGTNSIRMIQLSGNAEKGWTLDKFAYVPVDQKITKDDSETGKRKLGEIILGAREQAGIKTKNIAIGLPARKTYTAIIEVPNAPQRELTRTNMFRCRLTRRKLILPCWGLVLMTQKRRRFYYRQPIMHMLSR